MKRNSVGMTLFLVGWLGSLLFSAYSRKRVLLPRAATPGVETHSGTEVSPAPVPPSEPAPQERRRVLSDTQREVVREKVQERIETLLKET